MNAAAGPPGRRPRRTTVPTKIAAIAVGVPEATIRQWARRGRLTRYGTPGRAEYDIEELTSIAEERTTRASRRG
ncbi:MAG TPA: MerR family transcriptional regulator [Streptosporangiaceae bacterium]|jgi:hypothetical protein|nr:MerR family transcriptional regulator [Streptosporangiaceae bacterium]